MVKQLLSIVVLCAILLPCVVAFSIKNNESIQPQSTSQRRSFLLNKISTTFLIATTSTTSTIIPTTNNANAVVLDNSQIKIGTLKDLTPEEAEQRFREGRATIDYLLSHYREVCDGGGDNVRRYLGTVGTSSGLFGIKKAMKALSDRADDIVEYTELSREIEQNIEQADGSAYMAIFVTTSTSYTPPEKYFNDGKIEIERCASNMDELAAMINLKF